MSLLRRMKIGRRADGDVSTLANPSEMLVTALTGGRTRSGQAVTVEKALGLAPFWRGVNILSGAVGMMPAKVYRRTDDGRVEVPRSSRPWQLLHEQPNPNMSADEFWALMESHLDTWGNAFAYKDRGGDGRVAALWLVRPERVQVGQHSNGSLFYVIDGDTENPLTDASILHVRGLSRDGVVGWSPVALHREQLGASLARDEFGQRFWESDATPGVVLIHPGKISGEAMDRVKAKWDYHHRGTRNSRRTAVLRENMQIHQMTMPLKDAQYVEGMRMDATTQALILGLPPYMVAGDNGGNSLTYTTTESQSLDLLKWTLSPRLVRIQNAVSGDPDLMPERWFMEFETGAVLRSTTKERYEAWEKAPHLTVDEMRAMDNLPPLPDGKGQTLAKVVVAEAATNSSGGSESSEGDGEPEGGDQE